MTEISPGKKSTLVNHLKFDDMYIYINYILLGLVAEIRVLEPPHKRISETSFLHCTITTIKCPNHLPQGIYQGGETAQRRNIFRPLIRHPRHGKNRSTRYRTGRN